MRGKPLAALIVAKHMGGGAAAPAPDGEHDYSDEPVTKSMVECAQSILDAIKSGDAHALAQGLHAAMEVHETGEPGEGEPNGDEGPPPEG